MREGYLILIGCCKATTDCNQGNSGGSTTPQSVVIRPGSEVNREAHILNAILLVLSRVKLAGLCHQREPCPQLKYALSLSRFSPCLDFLFLEIKKSNISVFINKTTRWITLYQHTVKYSLGWEYLEKKNSPCLSDDVLSYLWSLDNCRGEHLCMLGKILVNVSMSDGRCNIKSYRILCWDLIQ